MIFSIPSNDTINDFTLKLNKKRIKCNKSIVFSASNVLSKYIQSHPSAKGCSCEIQKLHDDFDISLVQRIFSGKEIIINDNNFDSLFEISKNLKIEPLTKFLSNYVSANFTNEINLQNALDKLKKSNFKKTFQQVKDLLNDIPVSSFTHQLFGACICNYKYIEIYIDLLEKLENKKVEEEFIKLVVNCKKLKSHAQNCNNNDSEVSFILRQLFEKKLIDHKLIQTLPQIPLIFSDIFSNAQVLLDEDRIKKFCKEGINPNSIAVSLRIDDYETLFQIAHSYDFDFTQKFDSSPFERCEFVNQGCYLIEYAAFFGSVQCFKLLSEKYEILPFNIAKYAVAGGNNEIVKICENKKCTFENTLSIAIMYHHQKIIEWLVNDKNQSITLADVNSCIEYANYTALQFFLSKHAEIKDLTIAARFNLLDFIKKYGPNIKIKNKKYTAVLADIACINGNIEVFDYFTREDESDSLSSFSSPRDFKKTNLSLHSSYQISLLLTEESMFLSACKSGNIYILDKFLNSNNFPREILIKGLFIAVKYSNSVDFIMKIFEKLQKFDVDQKNQKNETLIYRAAKRGNFNIINFLLKKGANVNSLNGIDGTTPRGETPLYIACLHGRVEAVRCLLQAFPEINMRTSETLSSALHAACFYGNVEIVDELLLYSKEPVNANLRDSFNRSPLHIVCENGSYDIASRILKLSIPSLNIKTYNFNNNSSSQNSSDTSSKMNSPKINQIFNNNYSLKSHDTINDKERLCPKRNDGMTPLEIAVQNGHIEIVEILLEQSTVIATPELLFEAVYFNMTEVVKIIIKLKRVFLNNKSKLNGLTPLSQAAINGNFEIMNFLLKQATIDINARNFDGSTVLHVVLKEGKIETLDFLLRQEFININIKDNLGKTPLHIACENGNVEEAKMLLEQKNIDTKLIDNDGNTAEDLAPTEIKRFFIMKKYSVL